MWMKNYDEHLMDFENQRSALVILSHCEIHTAMRINNLNIISPSMTGLTHITCS